MKLGNSYLEFECDLGGINDVIAPKQSYLRPTLGEGTMFLKLNMSLISNNLADVT